MNRAVLIGGLLRAPAPIRPGLLATQEAAHSKIPVLGYAVPYAIGKTSCSSRGAPSS